MPVPSPGFYVCFDQLVLATGGSDDPVQFKMQLQVWFVRVLLTD